MDAMLYAMLTLGIISLLKTLNLPPLSLHDFPYETHIPNPAT